MTEASADLSTRIAKASLWAIATQAIVRFSQIIAGLIYVIILDPAEIGVYFFALSVMGLAQLLIESGPGQAVIQNDREDQAFLDSAFQISMITGAIGASLLLVLAPVFAQVIDAPSSVYPIACISLAVILNAVSRIHVALARRRLAFRTTLFIEVATAAGPLFVGVPLAVAGYGIWAPFAGTIFGMMAAAILAIVLVDYRPRLSMERETVKSILGFSSWTAGESALSWLATWGGAFFVGIYLSAYETGVYRTSELVPLLAFGAFSAALGPVVLSGISKLRSDTRRAEGTISGLNQFIAILIAASGVSFILIADSVEALLGSEWGDFSMLITIQTVSHMAGALLTTFLPALIALDRKQLAFAYRVGVVLLLAPAYLLIVPLGLEWFVWCMLGVRIVVFLFAMVALSRTALSPRSFIWPALKNCGVAGIAGFLSFSFSSVLATDLVCRDLLSVTIFLALFASYLLVFERSRISEIREILARPAGG